MSPMADVAPFNSYSEGSMPRFAAAVLEDLGGRLQIVPYTQQTASVDVMVDQMISLAKAEMQRLRAQNPQRKYTIALYPPELAGERNYPTYNPEKIKNGGPGWGC